MEKLANNWLDDGYLVVFPGERLHGLERLPCRRNDHLGLTATGSGQHLGLNKACDRPQVREDRIYEVLAAVATDPRLRAVSAPDANDLTRHRRPPVSGIRVATDKPHAQRTKVNRWQ